MSTPKSNSLGRVSFLFVAISIIFILRFSFNLITLLDRCLNLNRFSIPISNCMGVFFVEISLAIVLIGSFSVLLIIFLRKTIF